MMKIALLLCLATLALSAQIQWTGKAGDSLWSSANNWQPTAVPTSTDDVVINALGGADITVSQPAAANSVTIAGGSYPQTVVLLSQLSVGAGGMNIDQGGTLQVQSNNDLPLISQGPVQFQTGSTFSFQSGAITGPGQYTITAGATLSFSQAALKLISAANLINLGSATIQASTIEIEKAGAFRNVGNLTVIGGVTMLSTDNTALFDNYGMFEYQGSSGVALDFQLNAYFYADLDISAGDVTIASTFTSNSSVNVPQGSTLTVAAGTSLKTFNVIKGAGELNVQGNAVVSAPIALAYLAVSDSGSLTFSNAAAFTSATIGGVVTVQASTTFANLTLAGGTLTGSGPVTVSGYLSITTSDTGNTNNFLSAPLILEGDGQSTVPIYFLLGEGGSFQITSNATYEITSTFSFGVQAGKPSLQIDGILSVTTDTISTDVDITGAGTFKLNGGTLVANGDTFTIGELFLAENTLATLNTVVLNAGSVSGTGGLNLTAAPTPASSIGSAPVSYLGVVNGELSVGSFAVTTFDMWGGTTNVGGGSTNTASEVNIYGGVLAGAAKLTTTALNLNLYLPATLSGVAIKTNTLTIQSHGPGTIQLSNGATIISDSTSMPSYKRNGVVFN